MAVASRAAQPGVLSVSGQPLVASGERLAADRHLRGLRHFAFGRPVILAPLALPQPSTSFGNPPPGPGIARTTPPSRRRTWRTRSWPARRVGRAVLHQPRADASVVRARPGRRATARAWLAGTCGRVLGDPRVGMTGIFLSLSRVLPDSYPLEDDLNRYVSAEHSLGHLLDVGIIVPRLDRLYDWSAASSGSRPSPDSSPRGTDPGVRVGPAGRGRLASRAVPSRPSSTTRDQNSLARCPTRPVDTSCDRRPRGPPAPTSGRGVQAFDRAMDSVSPCEKPTNGYPEDPRPRTPNWTARWASGRAQRGSSPPSGIYSRSLTVPGAVVPMGRASPSPSSHRRTAVAGCSGGDHAPSAPASCTSSSGKRSASLWAAEYPIYGRFGYAPATYRGGLTGRTERMRLRPNISSAAGRVDAVAGGGSTSRRPSPSTSPCAGSSPATSTRSDAWWDPAAAG